MGRSYSRNVEPLFAALLESRLASLAMKQAIRAGWGITMKSA
jgi:hypothetical protein